MIETVCTPYGRSASVVKCDGCGEEIDSGWMHFYSGKYRGNDCIITDEEHHWCDECAEGIADRSEFRVCDRCGAVMTEGYVLGESCDHACDDCFGPWMDENCEEWRENDHGDEPFWDGGYYDELVDGEWVDTGIYWTQWD